MYIYEVKDSTIHRDDTALMCKGNGLEVRVTLGICTAFVECFDGYMEVVETDIEMDIDWARDQLQYIDLTDNQRDVIIKEVEQYCIDEGLCTLVDQRGEVL